ncbi:MAG: hypothetical protein AAB403_00650 [Planctomycetota bacterium]
MKRKLKVSKLDAARRQIDTAIALWFDDGDPVAVHTLTAAAHELVHTLYKKRGLHDLLFDSDWIKDEYRKQWSDKLRANANFFKHADRDAEAELEFDPILNDMHKDPRDRLPSGVTGAVGGIVKSRRTGELCDANINSIGMEHQHAAGLWLSGDWDKDQCLVPRHKTIGLDLNEFAVTIFAALWATNEEFAILDPVDFTRLRLLALKCLGIKLRLQTQVTDHIWDRCLDRRADNRGHKHSDAVKPRGPGDHCGTQSLSGYSRL